MPSIKDRVLTELRRQAKESALQMTPSLLASMDAANVTEAVTANPWDDIFSSKLDDDEGD